MKFVRTFINKSHEMQQEMPIPRIPFKLDTRLLNEPSEFKIVFVTEGIKYTYMFSVTENEVVEEYLYYYPNGRKSTIFERTNHNKYKFTIDVERQTELKNKFHSPNKLFLSTESLWEYEKAKPPFKWLSQYFNVFINHDHLEAYTGGKILKNELKKDSIRKYMNYANIDIEDIDVKLLKKEDIINSEMFQILSRNSKVEVSKLLDKNSSGILDIKTMHKGIDENGNEINVSFRLSEEFAGTQKYFGILGTFLQTLQKGYTLIIDELDIRLHTLLVLKLVQLFLNPEINKKYAQLIFTTHDTNFLDSDMLRRDQIWFVEKKQDRSTDLYSLYDFGGVRKNDKIEKGYLQGKYGAIPYFKGDLR